MLRQEAHRWLNQDYMQISTQKEKELRRKKQQARNQKECVPQGQKARQQQQLLDSLQKPPNQDEDENNGDQFR